MATALNVLANVHAILEHYDLADTLFSQALAQRLRLLGPHHPEVAWTRYSYADMLRLKGDFAHAAVEAREVLKERGGALPESHPMIHSALQVLGRSLLASGSPREAEPALRESLRLRAAAYGAGHWLVASASGGVGECLLAQKKYAAAEPLLLSAYTAVKQAKGGADARVKELSGALARLYTETGKPTEAAKCRN